jgi:hypothetical protein
MVRMGQLGSRRYRRAGRNAMRPGRLIIRLIIQTIRRVPSGSVWIDDASNVSRPDRSGADQIDAEHQATHLALGAYALAWEASNLSLRDRSGAKFQASVQPSDGPSAQRPPRPIAPV